MDGDATDAGDRSQMSSAGEETFHLVNAPARARPPGSEASWTDAERQLDRVSARVETCLTSYLSICITLS